jgi:Flp pilus assembly protein TadD
MKRRIVILSLIVLGLGLAAMAADWFVTLAPGRQATYVGRETCARCHQPQVEHWTGSDHDLAMDLATDKTVLGNFDNQEFTHFGVTSRFFREGKKFCVTTEDAAGKMTTFDIKYVFGVRPLQQYMVEFPDGRVQVLGIAWDTKQNKWFDLHPDERIPPSDELHWTKPSANWNHMCAECHSTNVHKNYNLASNTFHTTFSEIDVSCEACHGPGSIHVELAEAKSLFWDRHYGYGLAKLKDRNAKTELETCARCHARRRIVHPDYSPGREFLNYYEPELLSTNIYYPDGQIQDEVYEYGSFLQSRMHRENVRCTDCHDPHSIKLKRPGNQLCTHCHTLAKGNYDAPAHHHHPFSDKPNNGTACVDCHMPVKNYMVVDPRRDHSLRVPRPDLSVELGTPNACMPCHKDKSNEWARDKVIEWYGPTRKRGADFARTIAAAREAKPAALKSLVELARPMAEYDKAKDVGPIVRATAASLLGNYSHPASREALLRALVDPEPLVRAGGVHGVELAPIESEAQFQRVQKELAKLLRDPIRLVRTEAARVLTRWPRNQLNSEDQKRFEDALAEWTEGQDSLADQSETHVNLAIVRDNLGDRKGARAEYQIALQLDPSSIRARINLAMLEHLSGDDSTAEKLYREVIALRPDWDEGHLSLGLLLSNDRKRRDEALASIERAVKLSPKSARMQYNYGAVLHDVGRLDDAETHLLEACRLEPESQPYQFELARLYVDRGRWEAALKLARELVIQSPGNEQYRGLLADIERAKSQ